MESYNSSTILSDLDELISVYINSEDENKKKLIYNQMLFASNIDPKTIEKKEISKYKPKDYNRYQKDMLKTKKLLIHLKVLVVLKILAISLQKMV